MSSEVRVPLEVANLLSGALSRLGVAVMEQDLQRTPLRMAQALADLTYHARTPVHPEDILLRQFDAPSQDPQMIFLADIDFISVCEHHILPFTGTATVGYLPKPSAKVAGISKLARLVQAYARMPQMQERLGQQVIDALTEHLDIQGAGCLIDAVHTCVTLRGPRAANAHMITSHLSGVFLDAPVRGEFLALART